MKASQSTSPPHPIADGQEVLLRAAGQEWIITWHPPGPPPAGRGHGSAGICVTGDGGIVLVSADGASWGLPGGRPEAGEDWEQTLRREMLEEACAVVLSARLLGFSRGRCIRGHEQGLVNVRAVWRAEVALEPWEPRFEILHRRVVGAGEVLAQMTLWEGDLPTYLRALSEAGVG